MRCRRTTALLLIAAVASPAGCTNVEEAVQATATPPPADAEGRVIGDLHPCAEGVPIPDELSVVESVHTQVEDDLETCVVTMETDEAPEVATDAYRTALEGAGWSYLVQQEDPNQALLQLEGPHCGIFMVLSSQAAGRPDARAATTAYVSLLPCDRMPPGDAVPAD